MTNWWLRLIGRHPRLGVCALIAVALVPCVAFPFAYEALVRWVH